MLLIETEETTVAPLNFTDAVPIGVKFSPVTLTVLPGEEFRGLRRTLGGVDADTEIGTINKEVM